MIRFVDLRGKQCDGRFAWYDTVTCSFMRINGEETWNTFLEFNCAHLREFGHYLELDHPRALSRFYSLTPQWAQATMTEEEADRELYGYTMTPEVK